MTPRTSASKFRIQPQLAKTLLGLAFFLTLPFLRAASLPFQGGVAQVGPGGKISLQADNHSPALDLELNVVVPKWLFCTTSQYGADIAQTPGADSVSFRGGVTIRGMRLPYSASFSIRDQALCCAYELEVPPDFKLQCDPVIVISGVKEAAPTNIRLGITGCNTDGNGSYGDGKDLLFERQQLRVEAANPAVFSIWSNPKRFSVRITLAKVAGKPNLYRSEFTVKGSSFKLKTPMDTLKTGKQLYLRYLSPPSEPELNRTEVLKLLDAPGFNREKMDQVEKFLDLRARLYSAADAARHRAAAPDPAIDDAVRNAYARLGALDFKAAATGLDALEKAVAHLPESEPLTARNPYSFLRDYTPYGFSKHPEGVFFYEPSPFNIQYQDGLRFRLLADKRVRETVVPAHNGAPAYYKVDFTEPVQDITVARDWTGALWKTNGVEYRFNVLTPMIDVEGVNTLELSGFSPPPTRLEYVDESGVGRSARFSEKSAWTFDPRKISRPFLLLTGENWALALLPGARPTGAVFEHGVLRIGFDRKSYVGIVKIPSAYLHPAQYPRMAELFAEIAVAPPVSVRESVSGDRAVYRYRYRERPNAWNLAPFHIAPVPPLMTLAGASAPDAVRTAKYPTRYGLWQYAEGDSATCQIPPDKRTLPLRRGVNVYYLDLDDMIRQRRDGADWIRLYIGTQNGRPEEAVWTEFEKALETAAKHKIPLLIDPHQFIFQIRYGKSFPPDGEGQKRFVEMWERIAKVCSRYPDIILGYDLYNEPGAKWGSEKTWNELEKQCIAAIRKYDRKTPVYLTGVDMENPSGYFSYVPAAVDGNCVVSFHFYTPHPFTHQKIAQLSPQAPGAFYPGYVTEGNREGYIYGDELLWFDRWSLGAALAPVFEFHAEFKLPMHCGEFSVVGWANRSSEAGALCWTRDTAELLEHAGFSWHLWNGGFGFGNKLVKQYILEKYGKGKSDVESGRSENGI